MVQFTYGQPPESDEQVHGFWQMVKWHDLTRDSGVSRQSSQPSLRVLAFSGPFAPPTAGAASAGVPSRQRPPVKPWLRGVHPRPAASAVVAGVAVVAPEW